MFVCVAVTSCTFSGPAIQVGLSIATSAGHQVGTDVTVNFARTSLQINNDIVDRAKAALTEALGVVVQPTDTVKVFGGAVL